MCGSPDRARGHVYEPHRQAQVQSLSRRELLKLAPLWPWAHSSFRSYAAATQGRARFSDWASAKLFRSAHLAPTFADSDLTPFDNSLSTATTSMIPELISTRWTLSVAGAVQKPGELHPGADSSAPQDHAEYPACMRGGMGRNWPFWGRAPFRLSETDRRRPDARFVTVQCADDYYESLDMPTAMHPQTLLCYEMYDQPLTRSTALRCV